MFVYVAFQIGFDVINHKGIHMIKLIKILKIVKRKANMSNLKFRKSCCDQLSHFLQFVSRQLTFPGEATRVQHLVQYRTMNEPPYNSLYSFL